MSADRHTLLDGKVHVYRRENSRCWQCAIYLNGRNHRASTRQLRLDLALDVAREWALDRIAEQRLSRPGAPTALAVADALTEDRPPPRSGQKTFEDAGDAFLAEYQAITQGERSPKYVARKAQQLQLHLLPFFGKTPLPEVTAGLIQEYRVHRLNPPTLEPKVRRLANGKLQRVRPPKRPSRSTLHRETALDLKADREGNPRTAYSLRHTYICIRLMAGADIYQPAKNCRTSVEMIETFYASHIKTRLDASAINVRRTPNRRMAPSAP